MYYILNKIQSRINTVSNFSFVIHSEEFLQTSLEVSYNIIWRINILIIGFLVDDNMHSKHENIEVHEINFKNFVTKIIGMLQIRIDNVYESETYTIGT